jgi:hypothetical protein
MIESSAFNENAALALTRLPGDHRIRFVLHLRFEVKDLFVYLSFFVQ